MGRLYCAVVLLSFVRVSGSAFADDAPTTARLDFQSTLEGCMDAARFGDEVAARVGRVVFADDSASEVRVRVFREGDQVEVTVSTDETTDRDGNRTTRQSRRTFRDPSCVEALEAAAAAVAVWIDEGPLDVPAAPTDEVVPSAPAAVFGGLAALDDGLFLVRVSSNRPGFSFHIETNTGRGEVAARFFERLCVMPCEARVRPGVHQFGIADGVVVPAEGRPNARTRAQVRALNARIPWALPELTEVREDIELFVELRRASGWNIAGRYLFTAGFLLVAPFAITISAIKVKNDDWGKGMLWASIGISSALVVGGALMFSIADGGGVEVQVRPLGAQ
ncbi:MAG: hypothetical protein MUE69_27900 [Myxococcota bacterium]|jgi:hypothetical protein|nr:hypothetical protein [Myxococcota bacterium]